MKRRLPYTLGMTPRRLRAILLVPLLAATTLAQFGGAHIEDPAAEARPLDGIGEVTFRVESTSAEARAFFDQGIALLHGAWHDEAERAFLQVAKLDTKCAAAWWGRCLANPGNPSRATWFAWEAYRRREQAPERERAYIDAWARYYGATTEPKTVVVDAESGRRAAIPRLLTASARARLEGDLLAIVTSNSKDLEARALLLRQRWLWGLDRASSWSSTRAHLDAIFAQAPDHPARRYEVLLSNHLPPAERPDGTRCRRAAPALPAMWYADGLALLARGDDTAAHAFDAASRIDHAHMKRTGALPFEQPWYVPNLIARTRDHIEHGRRTAALALARALQTLPRHPRYPNSSLFMGALLESEAARMPEDGAATTSKAAPDAITSLGPATWVPQLAPNFHLDRGQGGKVALTNYTSKKQPLILVHYLGAGCLHCVEQLADLAPKASRFRRARLPILPIGTDDLQGARAFIQLSMESGQTGHLPFPILCDPLFDSFHAYGAWSGFTKEALHGTYMIDSEGRVRWRDISIEPFMETEFLLEECKRLLAIR